MKKKMIQICASIMALALLTSCAKELGSSTYTEGATAGVALEGVVVSARPIQIKANDKLSENTGGMIAGGAAGAALGNSVGGGTGRTITTVGGALAGALIGSAIQSKLGNSEGMEYVVKVSKGNMSNSSNGENHNLNVNNSSVAGKIKSSMKTNTKTELISVIQGKDIIFSPGQRVYVIYSDDRPRIVAAQ